MAGTQDPFAAPDPFLAPPEAAPRTAATATAAAAPARPTRDLPAWATALITVLSVGTWLGIYGAAVGIPVWLASAEETAVAAGPELMSESDAAPLDARVPDDWMRVPSPSLRLHLSVDADWYEYEDFAWVGEPGADGMPEDVGSWSVNDIPGGAGTWVNVYATHDAPAPAGAEADAYGFLSWWTSDYDAFEITGQRRTSTLFGYDAYEIQADAVWDGIATHDCLIAVDLGESQVQVYGSAALGPEACTDVVRAIAQSVATS